MAKTERNDRKFDKYVKTVSIRFQKTDSNLRASFQQKDQKSCQNTKVTLVPQARVPTAHWVLAQFFCITELHSNIESSSYFMKQKDKLRSTVTPREVFSFCTSLKTRSLLGFLNFARDQSGTNSPVVNYKKGKFSLSFKTSHVGPSSNRS